FLESRSDPAGSEPSGDRLRTALSATLGYGWGLRSGMWTPYAEYRVPGSAHGATRQTAGLRFLLRDRLQGRAYGERQLHANGRAASRVRLELRRLF
ncbi:MAG: hypothetical protein ISN29_11065, partial [Gammaproteobacteria bacterium AqS3]|nr:hypothetical protein [Gammaproteobacteria bacterium AqS3]